MITVRRITVDVRPETINRRIRDICQILTSTGHTITPADQRLSGLDGLYAFADGTGIRHPAEIKTASQ